MPETPTLTRPVLTLDIGQVTTRALLFDLVEGQYRLLGIGSERSTVGAPFYDVSEGIYRAIRSLQDTTGKVLLDSEGCLIYPGDVYGNGVNTLAVTTSGGPPLKVALVGLHEDVSLQSLQRLASALYIGHVVEISPNDRQRPEEHIETLVSLRPDLILVAGGFENGALHPVLNLVQEVAIAVSLFQPNESPDILFLGNSSLHREVEKIIGPSTTLRCGPNIRPGLELEQLELALEDAAVAIGKIRSRQLGQTRYTELINPNIKLASIAMGRLASFISRVQPTPKGVLVANVETSATSLIAAYQGKLTFGVHTDLGLARSLDGLLDNISVKEISHWLSRPLPDDLIHAYLCQRALYPETVPLTTDELAIEQAAARLVLQLAIKRMKTRLPHDFVESQEGSRPGFEPIIAVGSILTQTKNLAQTLLVLLDGIQPAGITTIILDPFYLIAELGALCQVNPTLVVQVLESFAFKHLGTVITPVGKAREGTPVLRVKMFDENGHEAVVEVLQGSICVLPLPAGQSAHLHLQPYHKFDIGMGGPGLGGTLKVVGGLMGVVIDGRGRPLSLPDDPYQRYELHKKWAKQMVPDKGLGW
jgi:hypothetical protein